MARLHVKSLAALLRPSWASGSAYRALLASELCTEAVPAMQFESAAIACFVLMRSCNLRLPSPVLFQYEYSRLIRIIKRLCPDEQGRQSGAIRTELVAELKLYRHSTVPLAPLSGRRRIPADNVG